MDPCVRLRKPSPADIPAWVEWLNDAEVTQGLSMPAPIGYEDQLAWFKKMTADSNSVRLFSVEYKDKEQWVMVGHCNFQAIDLNNRSAEVGFFLGYKKYWNCGIGSKVAEQLLEIGFTQMNLHRIWLRVFQTNPRAIRAYQKVGFNTECTLRQARYKDGKYLDFIVMSILKTEWESHNMPLC